MTLTLISTRPLFGFQQHSNKFRLLCYPTYPRSTFTHYFSTPEISENVVAFTTKCPWFFGRGCSAKTVYPHQNLRTKGTSLGCRLAFLSPEIVPFELYSGTPSKITLPGQFLGLQNPYAEIQKNLTNVRSGTPIHVCCFKRGRNRCKISVRKAALYWCKNKTRFGCRLAKPLGRFLHILWECALWSHTYIPRFIQIRSGLGEL